MRNVQVHSVTLPSTPTMPQARPRQHTPPRPCRGTAWQHKAQNTKHKAQTSPSSPIIITPPAKPWVACPPFVSRNAAPNTCSTAAATWTSPSFPGASFTVVLAGDSPSYTTATSSAGDSPSSPATDGSYPVATRQRPWRANGFSCSTGVGGLGEAPPHWSRRP